MNLQHKALVDLLRMAYSAEKAAAFAYQGHAASVKSELKKAAIKQIEINEWNHRHKVLTIMNQYGIEPSCYYEIRFHIVGKLINTGCYIIGWFMPFYFAGHLESGNVCKYFRMIHFFFMNLELESTTKHFMIWELKKKNTKTISTPK
jgi:hypothetical protein